MATSEYLLHYVWKYRIFDRTDLQTVDGEPLEIIDPGVRNSDAGADFFNAKIRIGEKIWAGDVELHGSSDEWTRHGHHTDERFNSVILHVAERVKGSVRNQKGALIPQMQLIIPEKVKRSADYLLNSRSNLPCRYQLPLVEREIVTTWLAATGIERLERKINDIRKHLERFNNSWDQAFYVLLTRNFGFGLNSDIFERLALSLPFNCIMRHGDSLLQVEALLCGQAGMLYGDGATDDYCQQLRREYEFLRLKYRLQPVPSYLFKQLRVRPNAFPQVRIAQLAALLKQRGRLFPLLLEEDDPAQLRLYFQVEASDYWHTHYSFGKRSTKSRKYLGDSSCNVILINTVVPMFFVYGQKTGQEKFCERAMQLLESLKPERNAIITEFEKAGIFPANAFDSQALIQLRRAYCERGKCLYCKIGYRILSR